MCLFDYQDTHTLACLGNVEDINAHCTCINVQVIFHHHGNVSIDVVLRIRWSDSVWRCKVWGESRTVSYYITLSTLLYFNYITCLLTPFITWSTLLYFFTYLFYNLLSFPHCIIYSRGLLHNPSLLPLFIA